MEESWSLGVQGCDAAKYVPGSVWLPWKTKDLWPQKKNQEGDQGISPGGFQWRLRAAKGREMDG
jgi:hypothetical protein